MRKAFVIFALITLVLLGYATYQGLVVAPREATMGDVQRIFYYHVPSAAAAFTLFFVNFIASIVYLINRSRNADAIAVSTAEVGVVFCSAVLVSGPLWAKPAWGIWWTWDARLTSTLVLWLVYVSYLILRRFSTGQTPTIAAVLAIFAYVDVPFVYMANRLFRTQHPQPVFGGGENSGIDPQMMTAFLWNMAAFLCFAALLVALRYMLERARHQLAEAEAAPVPRGSEGRATSDVFPLQEKALR